MCGDVLKCIHSVVDNFNTVCICSVDVTCLPPSSPIPPQVSAYEEPYYIFYSLSRAKGIDVTMMVWVCVCLCMFV